MADYLQQFTTLAESTPIEFQSGPMEFVNDAISQNPLVGSMLNGRDFKDVFQGGPEVRDRIILEYNSRFQSYQPGRAINIANNQSHVDYKRPWAFNLSYLTWTDQELLLNNPSTRTKSALRSLYKDVLTQKHQDVMTDIVEGMDNALLAVPNADTMEAAEVAGNDDRVIYSLFSLINEDTNGLWGNWSTDADNVFTTKYGLAPGDYTDADGNSAWVPKQLQYHLADLDDERNGLLAMFEEMLLRLEYKQTSVPVPFGDKKLLGDPTQFKDMTILTGLTGMQRYREALHAMGDRLQRPVSMDPTYRTQNGGYVFNGIELMWSSKIDSLALFEPGSGNTPAIASAAENAGPRFWWINNKYLSLKFHTEKMLEKDKPRMATDAVDFWWQPVKLWWQLFPRSIRRHGIVYPGAPASGGAS
jgi:hypothetical protein